MCWALDFLFTLVLACAVVKLFGDLQSVTQGLSDILLTSKGGNKAFSPPPPHPSIIPCNVVPLFKLPVENNKHPNFELRGGGGMWIVLFSEITLFEYNVSTTLSLIVYRCKLALDYLRKKSTSFHLMARFFQPCFLKDPLNAAFVPELFLFFFQLGQSRKHCKTL